MKRTCRKIFSKRLLNHTSNWPIGRRFQVQFFYVILWEGNVELNINQTYQYLVYYDHEKINTRIVSYAIDSFAFMSILNSHRLDALGKVTEGFSPRRAVTSLQDRDQTTDWYSSRLNRTKLWFQQRLFLSGSNDNNSGRKRRK